MVASDDRYFEMVVVTELIEQEVAALRRWIDRRKEVIDQCRNCFMAPPDVLEGMLFTGDEVLHKLGQINRLVTGKEATFARRVGMWSDWAHPAPLEAAEPAGTSR